MQRIPLKLAKPEMVLAKAVLRDNGQVLLAEGTELSQGLLDRLHGMNVESITVKGSPVALEGLPSSDFNKRAERLDHLFRKHGKSAFMLKLKGHIHAWFAMKAAAQAAELLGDPEEGADENGEAAS